MLMFASGPEPVYNARSQKSKDIQSLHREPSVHQTPGFNYVTRLKAAMQQLKAVPPRQYQNKAFVDSNLSNCSHAFVCQDSVCKPLQQPYDGPYQILSRADKHFTLDVSGKKAVISLDRLKPTYLNFPSSTSLSDPPQDKELVTDHNTKTAASTGYTTTRSGRCVHWPKRLASYQTFTGGGVLVADHAS